MSEEKAKQGRARICGSTAPMELRDVQFVIEAASEKMEIKKEVFRELAMEAGPKTIVATNTSALPVSELAEVTVSPERVIGLHFFNPVSRMKLVEVVIAKQTSDETRDHSLEFVRQIGKVPVIVRDSPGFLVNRVLFPYLLDAAELVESGVERRANRSCAGAMGNADGSIAVDRRNRRGYHDRYRQHPRESLRATRSCRSCSALAARPPDAWPQNRSGFLQIRSQEADA